MDWLGVLWYSLVGAGVAAGLVALAAPERRTTPLTASGSLFLVAGFLGILSIGIVFVALAVLCFAAARRAGTMSS